MATQYFETEHILTADDGQQFGVTVKHVTGITPKEAKRIFDQGIETGAWDWKEKIWHNLTGSQIDKVKAAARFYYGWDEGTERFGEEPIQNPNGIKRYWFKAYYVC